MKASALLLAVAALLALSAAVEAVGVAEAAKPRPVAAVGKPDGYGRVTQRFVSGDRAVAHIRAAKALADRLASTGLAIEKVGKSLSVLVQGKLVLANEDTLRAVFRHLADAAYWEKARLVLDLTELAHCGGKVTEKVIRPELEYAGRRGVSVLLLVNPKTAEVDSAGLKRLDADIDRVAYRDVTIRK